MGVTTNSINFIKNFLEAKIKEKIGKKCNIQLLKKKGYFAGFLT
jgi:hypothetical protein